MNIIVLCLVIINTLHSVNMSPFDLDMNWMLPVGNQPSIVSRQLSTVKAKPTCGPVSFPDYSCENPTTPLAVLKRSDGQTNPQPQQQVIYVQLAPEILRTSYEVDRTPWKPKGREIIWTFKKDVTTWKSMLFPRSNYGSGKFGGSLFESVSDKHDYTIYEEAETRTTRPTEQQLSQPPPESPHFRSDPLNEPDLAVHPPVPQNMPVNNNVMFRNNNAMLTGKTDQYSVNGVSQHVMSGRMTSRYMQPQMNMNFRVSAQSYPYRNIPISTSRGLMYNYNPATFSRPPVRTIKEPNQGFRITNKGLLNFNTNQNKGTSTLRYLSSGIHFVTVAPVSPHDVTMQTMTSIGQLLQTADIQNTSVGVWTKFKTPSKAFENIPTKDPMFGGINVHHTSIGSSPEENMRDHNINIQNTSPTLATDDLSIHEPAASFLKQDELLRILNFNKHLKEKSDVTVPHDKVVMNSSPNKLPSVELLTQSNTANNAFNEGIRIDMNHGVSVGNTVTEIARDNIGIPRDAPNGTLSPPVTNGDQFGSNTAQSSNVNNQSRDEPNTTWSSQATTQHYDSNVYNATMTPIGNYTLTNVMSSSIPGQRATSQGTMFNNNNNQQWSHIGSESNGATSAVDKLLQSVILGTAAGQSRDTKSQDGSPRNVYPQDTMQYGVTSGNVVLPPSEIPPGITAAGNMISPNVMSRDNKQSVEVDLKYTAKPQDAQISTH